MASQETRDRIERRLEELYLRHLALHDDEVAGYYESGVGYYKPEIPDAEPARYVRDVLSVMHTCGMYDFAGEWAYRIGIPAKSGVSGGILAVVPGKLGIGVFSPGLDAYGNSVRGTAVCEEISERLGLHVFADAGEDALLGPAI